MECPYCKAENRNETRYCSTCGQLLALPKVASQTTIPISSSKTPLLVGDPASQKNLTTSSSLVSGSRLQGGRYIVKRVLGQGGMGAALLATDIRLDNKLVVIKELISDHTNPTRQQDDVRNFKREVATLAHLGHPLIPSVTDHFQEGLRYFMVQEYVEGENLEERLEGTQQPMKEREILICASEILDILSYLAQQTPPIVHRDIKPANIIVGSRDRRAHLVDFGIARGGEQHKQTAALGTPGYAPPEQYRGNADPRSDLYALAATLHHLLTNRDPRNYPPFNFPPVRSLNPDLSVDIERVLLRGLVNDGNQRYQSASAMKQDIDAILQGRFGISGNSDSYTLGTTAMASTSAALANAVPAATDSTGTSTSTGVVTQAATVITPVQPLSQLRASQPVGPSRRRRTILSVAVILLVVLLVSGGALLFLHRSTLTTSLIGATKVGNEWIGISDGSFSFDNDRADGTYKQQAAQALQKNSSDRGTAVTSLNQAILIDSSDPEAHIYLEDLNVLSSGSPYITLVVGSMISGSAELQGVWRDDLQGAYVAQKEYNDGSKLPNGVKVRLLVANTGSKVDYVQQVAQQIVRLSQSDPTFVGVMGWPYSDRATQAIHILSAAHIPMVSETASSDSLSGKPYFFRIAPSNMMQGLAGADYALKTLHASKAALFSDNNNPYTKTLGQDFAQQFKANGGQVVVEENYTVGKPANLGDLLRDALKHEPDLIYFSGYAGDVSTLLVNLPSGGDLPVLGGDALYELSGYTSTSRANGFTHLHFTAFAYPDEWDILGYRDSKPAFFSEYPAAFDPYKAHQGSPYGFTREDNDVILSYDAMLALLNGSAGALSSPGKTTMIPQDLQRGLQEISGTNSFQGVSGQIAFDKNGDPVNKAFVVLYVDDNGYIHMEPNNLGQFLKS